MAKVEVRGINSLKPHVLHVALFEDDGTCVEIPVRKAHFDGLVTKTQQLAYAREAAEFHAAKGRGWEQKRNARRKAWDAEDKAIDDAKEEAAKAAEEARLVALKAEQEAQAEAERLAKEAKFLYVATGLVNDKEGRTVGITVTIQHHGRVASFTVAYTTDKTILEETLRDTFAVWEAQQQAKEAFLASMSASE